LDEAFTHSICNIFKEVTGLNADASREATVINYWQKKGWREYDFRLLIEFEFNDPKQQDYYSQPGNLTLRSVFNPAREARLLDIRESLVHRESRKKQATEKSHLPVKILMRCGAKIFKDQYEYHVDKCFEMKGACFY
jgi:hypothetical protein